jgi:hypothetical protein
MQKVLLLLLIPIFSLSMPSMAQGDLLITPIRVVFDGNKQKETLNLVNMGKDSATYSISFVQYNMQEDGSFIIIENPDSGQMFADPYLRIFPRKIKLAPGEPQVMMLQCRRKTDMPVGEYRSHLYFRAEKNSQSLGMKNPSGDTTQLTVQLIPVYGLSIPVIIRSGAVNASATLSNLKLDIGQGIEQILSLNINRTGNISIYGDITIEYSPAQGKPYEIGTVKGVGVYTNINKRTIAVKLNNTSGKPLTDGKLKVQYISNGETKRVVYAEEEMEIK